jgi:alpha-L-fucosidase 2
MDRRQFLRSSAAILAPQTPDAFGQTSSARSGHAPSMAQHDIVYLTPTSEGSESLPIGNGDLVGMAAMSSVGLDFVINKANLWDDRPNEPALPANWAWDPTEEERWTTIVSGCRLHVRSALPLLDSLYLDNFQARLSLQEARVQINSTSPLGKLNAAAWVTKDPPVLVVDYDESTPEPVEREIELERWGSRRLFHWYAQYEPRSTGVGLDGTEARTDGHCIWIQQKLRGVSFVVVARFVGGPNRTKIVSRHSAVITIPKAERLTGQVYLSIVTSEEARDPLAAARRNVDQAADLGRGRLLAAHRKCWADFWSKSFVSIPHDYIENLYYFNLYQLAASSQGAYPPTHCGSLWFWNHDVRRWGHYYHWNVQQQYWPVHAANHAELAKPYYEFRRRMLPEAEKYARSVHNKGGAFYSDVTDRSGRGTIHQSVMYIMTVGPQIAMDFWRHYLYTLDEEFLRDHAYPVMKATALFCLEILERDADGAYHMPRSTGYENHVEQRDTISDLATIRQHLPACIRASEILGVDADLRPRLSGVVKNLATFTVLEDATDENGNKLPSVFSSGLPIADESIGPDPSHRWLKQRQVKKGERQFNISFFVENAPIFPSGIIGLGQRGTHLFDVAVNTAIALGPGPAWNSLPIISLARLGRGTDSVRFLETMVERYQRFPQGFFAELSQPNEASGNRFDMATPFRLLNGNRTERGMLPSRWFDYPDLELGGVLMTAVNEMLMQSHDGVIRVFPAVPPEWKDASFHLRAVGAFMVTGEMRDGKVRPYLIESVNGSPCRTEIIWDAADIKDLSTGKEVAQAHRGAVVSFETTRGSRYLVSPSDESVELPQPPTPRTANISPKQWRGCSIGIPRQF